MRRLFLVSAITSLLVTMAALSHAATNLNSSRSNIYRVVSSGLTPDQIRGFLAEIDKRGPSVNEVRVREILRKIGGGQLDTKVQKIVILAPRGTPKLPTILLLESPRHEQPAIEFSDRPCDHASCDGSMSSY